MPPSTSVDQVRQFPSESSAIDTILSPGIVQVNVQGAFIVTEDSVRAGIIAGDGAKHDTDIRLPNHSGVVSHIALDVIPPSSRKGIVTDALCRLAVPSQSLCISPAKLAPMSSAVACIS